MAGGARLELELDDVESDGVSGCGVVGLDAMTGSCAEGLFADDLRLERPKALNLELLISWR